jgi:DNA-directed RNA polymerase subunit RPC12/RpoP
MFMVVVCYGCGRFLLAKSTQKTKRCTYCETRLTLIKAKKLAQVETAQEASNYLRAIKTIRDS